MADPGIGQERALHDLEERLERATRAAERLLAQVDGDVPHDADEPAPVDGRPQDAGEAPPAGWRPRGDGEWTRPPLVDPLDLQRLLTVLATVLERVPADLQQRLAAALRELLLALRALIDWCLERAQGRGAQPREVQDIPIL